MLNISSLDTPNSTQHLKQLPWRQYGKEGDSECGPEEEPPPQNYPFRSRPATNTQQYEPWPGITSAAAGM